MAEGIRTKLASSSLLLLLVLANAPSPVAGHPELAVGSASIRARRSIPGLPGTCAEVADDRLADGAETDS